MCIIQAWKSWSEVEQCVGHADLLYLQLWAFIPRKALAKEQLLSTRKKGTVEPAVLLVLVLIVLLLLSS